MAMRLYFPLPLTKRAGWGLSGYREGMRSYRLKSQRFPNLSAKVFHEKDIPVQVAVGNYDLGICGLDWVEELLVKYPSSALVKLRNLAYGEGALYVVASRSEVMPTIEEMQAKRDVIRIAGEYPNLAESFALNLRLRRFSIFPLWGATEVYPPESADLALIAGGTDEDIFNHDLVPISNILGFSVYLIANESSWERKDLSEVLDSIEDILAPWLGERRLGAERRSSLANTARMPAVAGQRSSEENAEGMVRLALPDGHQQLPTLQLLNKAGIQIDDYPSAAGNRRPTTNLTGVMVKVIRPQDMPLQVANGNFDLAVTGRDWLMEHLYQFPSSPVTELVPIRVASEYVNIADKCARDNHLGVYRVIPTWGASEAFLPEDADLLIENTETGRTIARHNLKIIDTLFESTACLIGNKDSVSSSAKGERIKSIAETLRAAVEEI